MRLQTLLDICKSASYEHDYLATIGYSLKYLSSIVDTPIGDVAIKVYANNLDVIRLYLWRISEDLMCMI